MSMETTDKIIAVDFDGTIVEHEFPEIGKPVPYAFATLRELQRAGYRLILYTMRSDFIADAASTEGHKADRAYLTEAVEFCRSHGLEFWAVNENPEQSSWTTSPKVYAHIYIDDAAFSCPMRKNPNPNGRPYVDWIRVAMSTLLTVEAWHRIPPE